MGEMKMCHRDCRQFAPVDVAKGICHLHGEWVPADGESCEKAERTPRCRHCLHFLADAAKPEMGVCDASPHEPKFFAYPDMVAVTCEEYREECGKA